MKPKYLLLLIAFFLSTVTYAQNTFPATGKVGIGTTTPNASSLLEIKSTTKGLLIPRMNQSQRDAIALGISTCILLPIESALTKKR